MSGRDGTDGAMSILYLEGLEPPHPADTAGLYKEWPNLPEMTQHGILNEDSDYRVHVGWWEGSVYTFRTTDGRNALLAGWYEPQFATQPQVEGPTAIGYRVPPKDIPGIVRLPIPPDIRAQLDCKREDSTSEKGRKSVQVVKALLHCGRLPVAPNCKEVEDKDIQVRGLDLIVTCDLKIQVKCDYPARCTPRGDGKPWGLYLQTHERNPRKLF